MRADWQRAQAYEIEFWKNHSDSLPNRGGQLPRDLPFVMSHQTEGKRLLEVGCGPMGTIYYCPGALKVGIDPLACDYVRLLDFDRNGVDLICGVGERLPLADRSIDVVICGNVLDHVERPGATLAEMRRVMREDATMLLTLHVIPRYAIPFRPLLAKIDPGHPHHLTRGDVKRLLATSGLQAKSIVASSPSLTWKSVKSALANIGMSNLMIVCGAAPIPPRA